MTDPRRHPDVFTAEEAAIYLFGNAESVCTIEGLRQKGLITGSKPGREYIYHRMELDAAIGQIFSHVYATNKTERHRQPTTGARLRLTGSDRV